MNWEDIKKEYETTSITLKELAEKHGVKLGTLKSRKSREGWERDATERKDATKVATAKKGATKKKQTNRSGNPNPKNQFTKRNRAAVTHGLFSKYLPEGTLEIMESINDRSAADLLYDQIQIQYAAIIRAQKIMWVNDEFDTTIEEKKSASGDGFSTTEYEIAFAWDKQANFMNAQSRAMGELRSLIKQFNDIAHEDDERRLKLEQMQLNADKTKAEIEKLSSDDSSKAPPVINIVPLERRQ
ncbi:phage terminase small subunit [Salmonella enterica]|uniref:phage terminase small subunit n=1 Tax=Salmonella enterica TaxID=28901 RepID=UPI0021E3F0A1|nr:phage terminase small subunit [Salmonella enterica]